MAPIWDFAPLVQLVQKYILKWAEHGISPHFF